MTLADEGCLQFPATEESQRWAEAARRAGLRLMRDPDVLRANLRHGGTWFVGVGVLPNGAAGAIGGVPLQGPWDGHLPWRGPLHRAQLSVACPGYPARDPDQTEANHRYRVTRKAAHVDGLLPTGPDRRRFPCEFHAYVLGIHLNYCTAAPTVWWPGSHRIMARALSAAIGTRDPAQVDVTDAYHAARREVFASCEPRSLTGAPGGSFLLHRLALHGTEPWTGPDHAEGRMIAFFRPEFENRSDWLRAD